MAPLARHSLENFHRGVRDGSSTPMEGCLHAYLSVGAKDPSHLIYKLYLGALIGQERGQRS
jgi:hypothetical protein